MNEKLTEILLFANQNPSCWLATCEDKQPRVRGMLMWFADETGFYFHTGSTKNLCRQFLKNPRAEAAFSRNADDPVNFETLRVTGNVKVIKDEELTKRLLEERPWLQGNINNAGIDADVVIFRIENGSAYIWNMSWNLRENEAPRVAF
ncbi:MAG: pyridoxamine 5'-phosphate oxidase family protein [Bacillota bacterium]